MNTVFAVLRTLLLFCFVLLYFACGLMGFLIYRDPVKRHRYFARNVSRWTAMGLISFQTRVKGINVPPPDKNYLFVSNHLGFLDIMVTSSLRPVLYITSYEMKNTPFLGQLCEMGGSLFVERRSRQNIQNEIGQIRQTLKDGLDVVLYPEGTSGHGAFILPFKKSLMTSAAGTGVAVKPIVLNYTHINGEPMSHKWREHVCWYGDAGFVESAWKLLKAKSVDVEVEFLEEVIVHSEEERREIAAKVQALVESRYRRIPYPAGQEAPALKYTKNPTEAVNAVSEKGPA